MELKCYDVAKKMRVFLLSGIAVLASALVYYVLCRSQLPWPGYLLELGHAPLAHLDDISQGTYPSFAFTLSIGLIAAALFRLCKKRTSAAIAGVWIIGLLHEMSFGTYSHLDILAGSAGAAIALTLILTARKKAGFNRPVVNKFNVVERLKFVTLMLVSATLATATSAYEPINSSNCTEYDENNICIARSTLARPVYLSYQALRSAVKVSEPRELTSVSRIYLYEDMLFVNERNEGIHIIDNRFPGNPDRIGFIEIPGNTEVSIRDDYLYADSYIDLVTLDLGNIDNITEIARQEAIFPYNARQNIPDDIRLSGQIDSTIGVVVGYQ